MDGLLWFIVLTALIASLILLLLFGSKRAVHWARKSPPAAALVGWALLFLGAGMNPQPPPQEQVEQANREKKIKKDAESGDPKP